MKLIGQAIIKATGRAYARAATIIAPDADLTTGFRIETMTVGATDIIPGSGTISGKASNKDSGMDIAKDILDGAAEIAGIVSGDNPESSSPTDASNSIDFSIRTESMEFGAFLL